MNTKYLPALLIVLTIAFASCKKDQNAISGKWLETKLVVNLYRANVVLWDTTYLTPFTRFDYIQFNDNGTCVTGSDFYLDDGSDGLGYLKTTQAIPPTTSNWNYSAYGSVYVLEQNPSALNFSGAATGDTVSINGNTLLLHFVVDNLGNKSVYDSYYTRQ